MTVDSTRRATSSLDGVPRPRAEFASSWRRQRFTVDERIARGRTARSDAPRSIHSSRAPAADLAGTPRTGVTVQLCGDAHLSNFGCSAASRRLVALTDM